MGSFSGFDKIEDNVDVHFNVGILLELLDGLSQEDVVPSLDDIDGTIGDEGTNEQQIEKASLISSISIDECMDATNNSSPENDGVYSYDSLKD